MDLYSYIDVEPNDVEILEIDYIIPRFKMNDIFIHNDIETSNVGILLLNSINKLESNNSEARNVEIIIMNACVEIPQIGYIESVIESVYIKLFMSN